MPRRSRFSVRRREYVTVGNCWSATKLVLLHQTSLSSKRISAIIFIWGIFVFIRIPLAKLPKTGEKNVLGSSQHHVLHQRRNTSRCATEYIGDEGEEDGKYDVTSLYGKRLEDVPNFDCVDEIDADQLTDFNAFMLSYVLKNRPVIIRNLARKQKAFNMWTDSYLIRRFENELLTIETKKNEDREVPKTSMSIERFLQQMRERPNELYAVHNLQNLGMKRDLTLPSFLKCPEICVEDHTFWMSSGGTRSVLHIDSTDSILLQMRGEKRFVLIHQDESPKLAYRTAGHLQSGTSPVRNDYVDLEKYPRFKSVRALKGIMREGDAIYIPSCYWHQVNSKKGSVNLAVSIIFRHIYDINWRDVWSKRRPRNWDAFRYKYSKKHRCEEHRKYTGLPHERCSS